MRKSIAIIALAAAACADASVEKEAREAVARDLRDPASAQFRDIKAWPRSVCGEVNGKNAMGAYVGFSRFWFDRESKRYRIDPQEQGDEISRMAQRGFEGEIQAICKG